MTASQPASQPDKGAPPAPPASAWAAFEQAIDNLRRLSRLLKGLV